MRRNENQFLLLGLLLREAKEYQARETGGEAAISLLNQIRKTVSLIDDGGRRERAALVSRASEGLFVAERLARQGEVAHALMVTRLALVPLLTEENSFQQP